MISREILINEIFHLGHPVGGDRADRMDGRGKIITPTTEIFGTSFCNLFRKMGCQAKLISTKN